MESKELKKRISESPNALWYQKVKETFNFGYVNLDFTFNGVSALYEFVTQQVDGWAQFENIPEQLLKSRIYFKDISEEISRFVLNYDSQSREYLDSYWSRVHNLIRNVRECPLPYDIPQVDFLLKVHKEQPDSFNSAYNFILGLRSDLNSKKDFIGGLLAYEFLFKDKSDIVTRRDSEKKSLNSLKRDFLKYLNDSEAVLAGHLKQSNDRFSQYVKIMDDLKSAKDNDFTTWFKEIKEEQWEKWYIPTLKKIEDLERTYSEKLKLEEPAKYWQLRSVSLKKQGWIALAVLLILVVITCISLGEILWKTPEQIYSSWFDKDKSAAIRWSIIYVTLISFIAFCVKAVSKVMFSSFHLARDSEERHTLTYFYLSLLKDSKVDEKDRQLIMQSLFSRAETGLLKDDSSPTMPNDAISKIISK